MAKDPLIYWQIEISAAALLQTACAAFVLLLLIACLYFWFRNHATKMNSNFQKDNKLKFFIEFAKNAPQIFWIADPTGKAVYFNSYWHTYTGISDALLAEVAWNLGIASDDEERWKLKWENAVCKKAPFQIEHRLRADKTNHFKWHLTTTTPLHSETGELLAWIGTSIEIDESIQARVHLEIGKQHFQHITEAIPQMVWTSTPEGDLDSCNDKFCEYSGLPLESLRGQQWHQILHEDDHFDCIHAWHMAVLNGDPFEAEARILKKQTEEYRWHLVRALPVRDHAAQVVKWFGTWTDIDGQKQEEKLRALFHAREKAAVEASRLKSQFLANMSHEIRTPLNGIVGMNNLLLETELNKGQRKYAEIVKMSSLSLLTIVNDILDFSKIEAGKVELESTEFSLVSVIEAQSEIMSVRAHEKELVLLIFISPEIPEKLRGDPGRIGQILLNLLSNAIKFTSSGQVVVRAVPETGIQSKDNAINVRFSVMDTGIGLPHNSKEWLFQPFTQIDNSTARKYEGTGLGLSICKRLVELMGGKIDFESALGSGTTFWFSLELELATDIAMRSTLKFENSAAHQLMGIGYERAESKKGAKASKRHNSNILVVEDNAVNQILVRAQLESLGFHCEIASNGFEALAALEAATYDAVLMDCHMPEMDGYEATQQIRQREMLRGLHTPIIALTANALKGDDEKCFLAGMDDYLSKPIQKERLIEVMDKWINKEDKEHLNEYVYTNLRAELGDELMLQIIEIFLSDSPTKIASMKTGFAQGNSKLIADVAHSLKSSSASLGAQRLSELCCLLEEEAPKTALGNLQATFALLQQEFIDVCLELKGKTSSAA